MIIITKQPRPLRRLQINFLDADLIKRIITTHVLLEGNFLLPWMWIKALQSSFVVLAPSRLASAHLFTLHRPFCRLLVPVASMATEAEQEAILTPLRRAVKEQVRGRTEGRRGEGGGGEGGSGEVITAESGCI